MGGPKKKVGKARRDKFYHLAKETGYRARSAFKLIQLNRKFGFLEKSRVCIDLCAAPGGWCQVAANHMPVSSVIVGVDLVAIKPIAKVTTLVDDITSDKCRSDLKKELKDWKADVVLNDGAPNVGQNWLQDAFTQAGLTLHALKLASEFLRKGGWFVTKVFRSQDYHALLWVFRQLFNKVHATKPQASRSESAEIFVVCQGYVAPDKLDPKFLDPKSVFKDVQEEPENRLNLLQPVSKKKKKAEGYQEGDYIQHTTLTVTDFINDAKYLDRLSLASQLVIDKDEYLKHPSTTAEVIECCKDIKILGKQDIKLLIYWRKKLAKTQKELEEAACGTVTQEEEEKEAGSEKEEEEIDTEVSRLRAEVEKDAKRKKKKAGKVKSKLREKMNLHMIRPGDKIDQQDDENLFDLKRMKTKDQLDNVESFAVDGAEPELQWDSDSESDEEGQPKRAVLYDRTEDNKDAWSDGGEEEGDEEEDNWSRREGEESEEEEVEEAEEDSGPNPLLADLGTKEEHLSKQAGMWFKREAFEGLDLEADEDYDIEQMINQYKKKGGKIKGANNKKESENVVTTKIPKVKKTKKDESQSSVNLNSDGQSDGMSEEDSDYSESDSDESDYGNLYDKKAYKSGKIVADDADKEMEVVKEVPVPRLDAVGLAIGAKLIASKKARRQMMDDSYNRFAFHDENLPDWFSNDEKKHMARHLPVTKADMQEYKDRLKAVNARPIKKIAEAKGRKKQKMMKRLEKARKKAEALEGEEGDGASEKEKWHQIKSIYKKATRQKKVETTYVVAKKGAGKRVSRPSGVKGRFKVVDPRLKKDNRKTKMAGNKKGKGTKPPRGKPMKGRKK